MKKTQKIWFSEYRNADAELTREKLRVEIRRIKALKTPITNKILEIGYLVERYFKIGSNEELLNANLQ